MRRLLQCVGLVLFFVIELRAQDPQFSQFYAAPLNLNPAFTGTGREYRATSNYRNQWPSIPTSFVTYAFSFDYNMKKLNSGFGFSAMADKAGEVALRSTSYNFLYAYMVRFKKGWIARAGLSFGYTSRNLDYGKLIFGDQLSLGNIAEPVTNDQVSKKMSVNYFDFASGALVYSKKYWLGFSASHINQPNQSIVDGVSILPVKYVLHGGARWEVTNGVFKKNKVPGIAPGFLYKKQGRFDQLDVGVHFYYEPVMLGVWYRGIPIRQTVKDNINQDAVTVLFGFKFKNISAAYSYDLTLSSLSTATGGAHEISLSGEFFHSANSKRKRPRRKDMHVDCPTFMK